MNMYKITTDDTLRETIQHGSSNYPFAYYPEDIWQFDFHRIDWHWHHELEFLTVKEGKALCLVGAEQLELSKGCGLFINSGILHRFEAKRSTPIPNIVFSPCLLAPEKSLVYEKYVFPVINSSAAYQIFDPHTEWQGRILQILDRIYALQKAGQPSDGYLCSKIELRTVQLLLQLWDILLSNLDLTDSVDARHLNHQQARLQTMMQYIHDHYREDLTLEEIAAAASVSKSSALHIFKSFIQIPPVAYLIQYRLTQAAGQLHTTEKAVAAIAEDTGFANAGYFCRKFRQHYQMSPTEYRRNQKNSPS